MKIVVGGQIEKALLAQKLQQEIATVGLNAEVEVKNDLEAAMAVQLGQANFYFGACNTGGGGALAMAIAILGANRCATLGMPGKILSEAEIINEIQQGKVAFGFTAQDIEQVVPVVIRQLAKRS